MTTSDPFATAVLAIDTGDLDGLCALLAESPELVHVLGEERGGDYFCRSRLLHHVAWNPCPSWRAHGVEHDDPARMPRSMPEVVALLLEAGADPNASNAAGNDTVSLLLTGNLASEAGLTGPLLDALEAGGARVDTSPAVVHAALANHSPEGARALLARGAPWDVRIAAGLGERDRVQAFVDAGASREELGLAALHAYVSGHPEVLDLLLGLDLDLSAVGVGNGTLLHRAAGEGRLDLVGRLTVLGADHDDRANPFRATPLDWADHAGHSETVAWITTHAADRLDLHQAAAHGLLERAAAILRDDSEAVHVVREVWRPGAVQPLRIAVLRGHRAVAELFLAHGADVAHVGADGRTALDDARTAGGAELVALLERRPAR